MVRYRILPGLLALLAAAIFLADVFLLPGLYVPAVVYVVPFLRTYHTCFASEDRALPAILVPAPAVAG